ncbi:MAG: glycosyltransferase family 2 protein [Planctomycetes bacterium]|nr:glycosyltransferase family 2 protein [Planctomycetota bacterium]
MRLTIVIPAYNEQDAIASTIERSLAARATIMERASIAGVDVVVVSDGSTDRTAEIARSFSEANVIEFEKNRGYGVAIKKGFDVGESELVGFLDADGTCDPNFFADLCAALIEYNADVAIGSRMGPQSRMPRLRRLGNRIYALILSMLSNKVVTDTASGMRVIRRSSLPRLYPLPDGMHFTPAISARVLMDDSLRLIELPMAYEERIGESKLHVVRDGIRFLRTIFEMSLMWQPAKMFSSVALICLATMTILALHPIELWLTERHLQEDMIYRLLFCSFVGSVGVFLLSAGILCEQLARLWDEKRREPSFIGATLARLYTLGGFGVTALLVAPVLAWLIGPGIWSRLTRGVVEIHWSRVVLAGLIAFGLCQMFVTVLVLNLVRFHLARRGIAENVTASDQSRRVHLDAPSRNRTLHPDAPSKHRPSVNPFPEMGAPALGLGD